MPPRPAPVPQPAPPPAAPPRPAPKGAAAGPAAVARTFWLVLGWVCVGLGIVGAFLPIMPTTVFMIAAAYCFGRGSPRARRWLLNHRIFGPAIVKWEADGAIAPLAKMMACGAMAVAFLLALWLGVPGWVLAVQAVVLLAAAAFILTRPS